LFVLPERQDPLVGSMLGKDYRVLEQIGVGGMAVVYLVEHQTLLKQFAAKVLSDELASSLEARARFTQEAHSASQLDHENIVRISDFGVTIDHRPFFVMELLRGKTLDQRLAEGRMSIEEVVAVCVPVARALAHAHGEGIVHLDVKPENIFLVQRSQGRWGVKVVDFGIAKTPLNPRVTKLGETNGSPLFMAPEQCRGDEDVDQRADVYSFGILLYLMMCGRLPFIDDSLHRVLQMQLVQLPPPPRQINAELSPELAAVVERALAKQREDRYPSMDALLVDLAAALPPGSDRLLIESQSGAPMADTPFSGAMSIRTDSQRERPITPPPMFASLLPRRKRSRPVLVALAAALVTVAAGLAWRELSSAPAARAGAPGPAVATAAARAVESTPPASTVAAPAGGAVTATPIAPGEARSAGAPSPTEAKPAAEEAKTSVPESAAPPEPAAEPVSEHAPASADRAVVAVAALQPPKIERSAPITKKPMLRTKAVIRPAPPRPPVKRAPAAIAAAGAPATPPVAAASAPASSLVPGHAGQEAGAPGSMTRGPTAPETPPARPAEPEPPPAPPPAEVARSETGAPRDSATGSGAAIAVKPVPAAPVKPAPPPPGALDATPSVVSLDVKGSLSPSVVRRSMDRTLASLRECYRSAARAGRTTPAIDLRLTFEIDENSLATHVATGGGQFGSLASCAAGVARQIRTQEAPDVGTAQVTTVIRFRPL
jgi:serine/threonine-protein kinase